MPGTSETTLEPSTENLKLMVVEANRETREEIAQLLRENNVKTAFAKNASEASEMMEDARFLDFRFDGLIVNSTLPDANGWRVINEFRREYPGVPVALVADELDLALAIWTRAQNVPVLNPSQLNDWLHTLSQAAA